MIKISDNANQILNIVKARFNLKDKSEAIEKVVLVYGTELMEPQLRPEYVLKLARIMKSNHLSQEEFEKRLNDV